MNKKTYELYQQIIDYLPESPFESKRAIIEHILHLGMNLLLKNKNNIENDFLTTMENLIRKYKNYLLQSIDLRILHLIKFNLLNEKKINLLINSLGETNIIDQYFFLEQKDTINLINDSPWIQQLKHDIDADFKNLNIDDIINNYNKK